MNQSATWATKKLNNQQICVTQAVEASKNDSPHLNDPNSGFTLPLLF